MQKQFLRFTLFLLMCLTLPLTATAQVVNIPDPNLRAAIEAEIGKPAGATITVAEMATLTKLEAPNAGINDLTGLEHATNLNKLHLGEDAGGNSNSISDLSPLAGLTNLTWLNLKYNSVSDISPLIELTRLTSLSLENHPLSDLSPLAGLTNLTELNLERSSISDLSFLTGLTNLRHLDLNKNLISDISPLTGLTNLTWLSLARNPLSDLSPLAELINLTELHLERSSISDLSPLVANMGLGDGDSILVFGNPLNNASINTHILTLRSKGVTVHNTKLFFPSINPISIGDTFTLSLVVEDVVDLAGWQLDIRFNPAVLKAVSVSEGDFLATGGRSTFFASGNINNTTGEITEVTAAFIGTGGISGTGALLEITFEAAAYGEGRLRLKNVRLGDPNGSGIPHEIVINPFNFKPSHDVNGDGSVNIFDLILIAQNFGQANPQADVNGDGNVNIFDLIAVAQQLGESTSGLAPGGLAWQLSGLNAETIQKWIDMAHAADDGSLAFQLGIANLKRLLTMRRPDTTALLANYPNPFNPETWIPYQLARAADVTLTIYDIKGVMVRRLDLGHQMAGYYTDRTKAAYWDGRNNLGESVGSGVYFYQLQVSSSRSIGADDFSAIRKMVILK